MPCEIIQFKVRAYAREALARMGGAALINPVLREQQNVAQKAFPCAILMHEKCNLLYFCLGLLIFLHFLLQFAKNVLILRRLRAIIIKNVR